MIVMHNINIFISSLVSLAYQLLGELPLLYIERNVKETIIILNLSIMIYPKGACMKWVHLRKCQL